MGHLVAAMVVMAAVSLAARDGHACTTFRGSTDSIPASGEHPANAAVILRGSALTADTITASFDGVPVEVWIDPELSIAEGSNESFYSVLALRFSPDPLPGQAVLLSGTPCSDTPKIDPSCQIAYVAGEPDVVLERVAGSIAFDLIRYTTAWDTSCGAWGSGVSASASIERGAFADESFVVVESRAYHEGLGVEDIARRDASTTDGFFYHYLAPELIGRDFPLGGWCVELNVRDAAGNGATIAVSCDACMFGEGEAGGDPPELSPIPGGPCDVDDSGSSSGGDDVGDESTTASTDATASGTGTTGHIEPGSESDPDPEDSSSSTASSDDGTGAGASDETVIDRGCGCRSTAPTTAAPLLVVCLLRRRRRLE